MNGTACRNEYKRVKNEECTLSILILCTTNYISGTDRVVQNLAHGLAARGVGVKTVIPWESDMKAMIEQTLEWHRQADVVVTAAPEFSRRNQGWRNVKVLSKFIRGNHTGDIVNIHYAQNTSVSLTDILAIRLAGKKPVVMVHHPTAWEEMAPRKYHTVKAALRLSEAVIGTTGCMGALLKQAGVPERKIATIPLGVTPPKTPISQAEARKRLGLPRDAFVICSLSRLMAEKGIYELLEAFSHLPESSIPTYLVIGGEGPERAAMEKKAGNHLGDRIRFLGRVENISEVYACGDVFALPSHWEGFGLVYVEAAFHGLPSIGTNAGGTPYVIENEETGILVPPHDINLLTLALARLRDQKSFRVRLGSAALARACTDFTEEKMVQRFHELFQQVSRKTV